MDAKPALPYEEAATFVTGIKGWVCKTCGRFYGDGNGAEHIARWCCAGNLKCATDGCEARVERGGWTVCDACREKHTKEKWLAMPEVPWDGETPLVLFDDDRYFFGTDELESYLDDLDLEMDDLMLVVCVPEEKPHFEMHDLFQDYLPEDMDLEMEPTEINKIVNQWIEDNAPAVWIAGKTRPTLASIKERTEADNAKT
jgi:hypothetical protein